MVSPEVAAAVDSGMRSQLTRLHEFLAGGMPRAGWKVAFNDPAVLARLGLDRSLVAPLDGRAILTSGGSWTLGAGVRARVEAEVAVRVGRDVAAGASLDEARAAISALAPAIEIVDASRASPDLAAMLADGVLHAATVFGHEVAFPASVPAGYPRLSIDGAVTREIIEGRVPADLAEIVVLVASTLGRYGESLRAGDRIICGSFIDPPDVAGGQHVLADFGAMGSVEVTFA
jgi:2-keto-4-pentenoate hydratase